MQIKEAISIIKDYAEINTMGDFLWALGELRQKIDEDSQDITVRETVAFRVFVNEGVKFFAKDEV